jgi:hypothetical protein
MTSSLDINLLPLVFLNGQEQTSLPGLYISTPPRRPARGRQADRLFLYFIPTSEAQLTPASQEQVLAKLALMYYKTSGSVTAALRGVAESLNALLLQRNVHSSGADRQAVGALCQAVVRDDSLYIALSGPAHAYILASTGVKHFHEPPDVNRILGVSKAVSIRYYHSELNTSDTLLFTYQPPSQWTPTLLGTLFGQGPESLRRRLAGHTGADFNAVLMQVRAGSGKTYLLRPKPGGISPLRTEEPVVEPIMPDEETLPTEEVPVVTSVSPEEKPAVTMAEASETVQIAEEAAVSESEPVITPTQKARPIIFSSEELSASTSAAAEAVKPASAPAQPRPSQTREHPHPLKSPVQKMWAGLLLKADRSIHRWLTSLKGFIRQIAPEEIMPSLPPTVLAIIAVGVPVIVVAIATLIYFQSGRQSQYELYYQQASQLASQAIAQTNANLSRQEWANVLKNLSQAGEYGETGEGQTLRSQAQTALDELDGILRLDFRNAITGGFPSTIQISRMAASNTELFILDAKTGSILRVFSASQGYQQDEDFQCGPEYPGAEDIGLLVDFAIASSRNQGTTTLIAMDADGNLLECSPGEPPKKSALKPPPTGLGKLKGFTLDQDNFYLLDPDKNAVWIYWGSNFEDAPELYFGESVPQMSDAIDLAVDQDDLYLLHADGHVTLCTYSSLSVSPTHCDSPVPFRDSRPGLENRILIPETPMTQIYASQPPDPSLYFMEPARQAIYHLSLRTLTFHQQFRPGNDILSGSGNAQPASAFALSADGRVVFLAFGNKVYYSQMP